MAAKALAKIDFKKQHPELYKAGKGVTDVRVARAVYLAVDCVGEPGGEAFQAAVGKIYALAYTTKFAMKGAGMIDFGVAPLECIYLEDPMAAPKSEWKWRLMLRIPAEVTAADLKTVRQALMEKKALDTSDVKRVPWTEGRALQTMHVGPYDKVSDAYARLMQEAKARGYSCSGPGHEVYLSDPRRVAPEKLKTIVRFGVKKG
jgi:hypothetical protein